MRIIALILAFVASATLGQPNPGWDDEHPLEHDGCAWVLAALELNFVTPDLIQILAAHGERLAAVADAHAKFILGDRTYTNANLPDFRWADVPEIELAAEFAKTEGLRSVMTARGQQRMTLAFQKSAPAFLAVQHALIARRITELRYAAEEALSDREHAVLFRGAPTKEIILVLKLPPAFQPSAASWVEWMRERKPDLPVVTTIGSISPLRDPLLRKLSSIARLQLPPIETPDRPMIPRPRGETPHEGLLDALLYTSQVREFNPLAADGRLGLNTDSFSVAGVWAKDSGFRNSVLEATRQALSYDRQKVTVNIALEQIIDWRAVGFRTHDTRPEDIVDTSIHDRLMATISRCTWNEARKVVSVGSPLEGEEVHRVVRQVVRAQLERLATMFTEEPREMKRAEISPWDLRTDFQTLVPAEANSVDYRFVFTRMDGKQIIIRFYSQHGYRPLEYAEEVAKVPLPVGGPDRQSEVKRVEYGVNVQATLFLQNRNVDISARMQEMLNQTNQSDSFVIELLSSHSGQRALAFSLLGRNQESLTELEHFIQRGEELPADVETKEARTAAQVALLHLDRLKESVPLRERAKRHDKFYRKLFEGNQKLYDQYAHNPYLTALLFFTYAPERTNEELTAFARARLERVAALYGYESADELDRFIVRRLDTDDNAALEMMNFFKFLVGNGD